VSQALAERLRAPEPAQRVAACREIARQPAAAAFLPALANAMGDADKTVSRAACDALIALGSGLVEVGPLLRRTLLQPTPGSDGAQRRWGAAFALAQLGPPGCELLPAAIEAMGSTDPDVRWAAARVLAATAALHEEALRLLLDLVADGATAPLRRTAVFALRQLAARPDIAAALIAATSDREVSVKRAALSALARSPHALDGAAPRLQAILRSDPDLGSRALAAICLGELGVADPKLAGSVTSQLEAAVRILPRHASDPAAAGLRRAVARSLARLRNNAEGA
jgi:HEAT repeat protein